MSRISSSAFADTKPHFELLDGLRGIAALLVVWYHINEGFAFSSSVNGAGDGIVRSFNHGYLAVDFFFILSGFVIGYAYDDRWRKGFTLKEFFRRRLIRLHPMVVMGALVGAAAFFIQGCTRWDGTRSATSAVMLAFLCAMFLIPAVPGGRSEVRGNGEMFPLNGPSWSLFFEYLGNILYALLLRRLPTKVLGVLAALTGTGLAWFALADVSGYGSIGVGWTLDTVNFCGGMLRMLFPYTLGMFLSRIFRPVKVRRPFLWCTVALVCLFSVPFISGGGKVCLNGIFEMFCIAVVFPALVWLAASGRSDEGKARNAVRFLGDISYPLYMVHYPVMYLFYSWMIEVRRYSFAEVPVAAVAAMAVSLAIAVVCLKFYDEPLRKWLSGKRGRRR